MERVYKPAVLEAAQKVAEILEPLRTTLDDPELQGEWETWEDMRDAVRLALEKLKIDGYGGCGLCGS